MAKIGRNEACPCGSGIKFKHCCAGKLETQRDRRSSWALLALALVGALAAVSAVIALVSGPSDEGPNRVWSAEHGHYHDAR